MLDEACACRLRHKSRNRSPPRALGGLRNPAITSGACCATGNWIRQTAQRGPKAGSSRPARAGQRKREASEISPRDRRSGEPLACRLCRPGRRPAELAGTPAVGRSPSRGVSQSGGQKEITCLGSKPREVCTHFELASKRCCAPLLWHPLAFPRRRISLARLISIWILIASSGSARWHTLSLSEIRHNGHLC